MRQARYGGKASLILQVRHREASCFKVTLSSISVVQLECILPFSRRSHVLQTVLRRIMKPSMCFCYFQNRFLYPNNTPDSQHLVLLQPLLP